MIPDPAGMSCRCKAESRETGNWIPASAGKARMGRQHVMPVKTGIQSVRRPLADK